MVARAALADPAPPAPAAVQWLPYIALSACYLVRAGLTTNVCDKLISGKYDLHVFGFRTFDTRSCNLPNTFCTTFC